jgi:hypothetical protein
VRSKLTALGVRLLLAAVPCSSAMADEAWLCSHEIDKGVIVHDRYRVGGDKIVSEGRPLRTFHVLQNTALVLVGAKSDFWDSPELHKRETAGTMIIVDKRRGEYREVMILLDRDFDGPFAFRGTCEKR